MMLVTCPQPGCRGVSLYLCKGKSAHTLSNLHRSGGVTSIEAPAALLPLKVHITLKQRSEPVRCRSKRIRNAALKRNSMCLVTICIICLTCCEFPHLGHLLPFPLILVICTPLANPSRECSGHRRFYGPRTVRAMLRERTAFG